MAMLVTAVPFVYFRMEYTHGKRLREVTPAVLYRCGQLSIDGFVEAVDRYGIRTIINAQDEYPDPDIERSFWDRATVKESELCRELGVRYVHLPPDLIPRRQVPANRPAAIERFLAIMDDPANLPVLVHCRAGLHRTGVLAAVYRMEYQGWTHEQAIHELRDMGFGEFVSSSANDYITQYILTYRRGQRNPIADCGLPNAD
jgi:protein tyrosine/serine phosphatase